MTAAPQTPSTGRGGAHAAAEPSLGELVKQASESMSTIVRGEIALAKLELRSSVKNAGVGVGAFGAAGVVLVFALIFGLLALAEGLISLGLPRWAGFLVVFGLLLLVAVIAVVVGVKKVKRVKAPQRTITTSKETVAYLKSHG